MLRGLQGLYRRLVAGFMRHFLYSFRSTMLSLYIPVIIAFILLTGMISYILAARQVEESARHEVENLVYQTRLYIDNRFQSILEQMTALADDPVPLHLMAVKQEQITPSDYLQVQSYVDTVRLYNSSIIDTVYINLNHGEFTFFRGDDDYQDVTRIYRNYRRQQGDLAEIHWQTFLDDGSSPSVSAGVDVYRLIGKENDETDGIVLFRLRQEFFDRIGQIPVSRQALEDDWVSRAPHMRLARQALESDAMRFYVPPMYLPEYRQIVDGSDRYLEQVLMGKLIVQEFLDQWAARFEKAERDYRRQQRETGR